MAKTEGGQLVLFDLDGTLTRKDTLLEFTVFLLGRRRFLTGLLRLSPALILLKLKVIPNWKVKEKFLTAFFCGIPYEDFQKRCDQFATEKLPGLLKEDALQTLMKWKHGGARVVIVSASAENWIDGWCKCNGITCIATRLEVTDGRLTGKIEGKNCHGIEKVNRIRELIDLSSYKEIHVYGDSTGDIPMLGLATHPHYRTFTLK